MEIQEREFFYRMKINKNISSRIHGSCHFCKKTKDYTVTEISAPYNGIKARLCDNCLNKIHNLVKVKFSKKEKTTINLALVNFVDDRPKAPFDVMNIIMKTNRL